MRIFLLAAALWTRAPARADIVFLNDGSEKTGDVVAIDAAKVVLASDGRRTPYPRADVLKVKLVRVWSVPGEDEVAGLADPMLKDFLKSPARAADYPDDGYVNALDQCDCVIDQERRSTCVQRNVSLILRERGKDRAGNPRFYFLEGVERARLEYARSITSGKIAYLDDTSVEEGAEYSQYPEYDRLRSTKFAIPNVSTGSTLDYSYRIESSLDLSSHPYAAGMSFSSYEPELLSRFTVTAPKGLELRWSEFKMPKDARFSREEKGGTVRYSWQTRRAPSLKEEDSMPPFARVAPQVTVAPADTWERVAARVASGVGARREAGRELAAKAAEIAAGAGSDERKAEALYNWVVREIKYEPVGMGSYSYLPKAPAEIYAAKAGDRLDKPFLLYVLLRAAGLKPQLVYMESKTGAPFDPALPTLTQFDAAVVRLELGGRELYLTPFDDALRYDAHPGWLQGMHGLVVDGEGVGSLVEIPQASAAEESLRSKMTLALGADGSISGEVRLLPRGSHQAEWRGYKDWKKEDLDLQFEKIVHGIHPNARLKSYAIEGLDDMTRDLVVRVSFAIPDYAITASKGFLAFRVPWTERAAGDVGKPAREYPMFWYTRDRATTDAEIALPAGYEVYYAPPPAALAAVGRSYRASYETRPGALVFRDDWTSETTEVSAADYPKYKALREETARFTQKWIVLRKKG